MLDLILMAFREKQKYIILIFLFVISFAGLLFLLLADNYYNIIIKNSLNKPINRGFEVVNNIDNIDEKLFSDTDLIEKYWPLFGNEQAKLNNILYSVNYYNSNLYPVKYGSNNLKENEIIISLQLLNILKLNENNYEKNIKLVINNNVKEFKIVGVSDIPFIHILMQKDTFIKTYENKPGSYYVLVSNHDKLDKLRQVMRDNGHELMLYDSSDLVNLELLYKIRDTYRFIMIIVIICLFIFIIIVIKNFINIEEKNIAIFKALGYKNIHTILILLLRLIIVIFIAYLIMQFESIIFYFIINNFLSYYEITLLKLLSYNTIILLLLIILILLNIFNFNKKINKLNILSVLSDY